MYTAMSQDCSCVFEAVGLCDLTTGGTGGGGGIGTGGGSGQAGSMYLYGLGINGDFTAVNATLAANAYYQNYTVPAGVTVKTNNFEVFASATLTVAGRLHNDGNSASGATPGGQTSPAGTFANTNTQGGVGGSNGNSVVAFGLGGNGGDGGDTSVGNGGTGGTVTPPTAAEGGLEIRTIAAYMFNGMVSYQGAASGSAFRYGASGAGGGNGGGGGGAGGSAIKICAKDVVVEAGGIISALGGAGGTRADAAERGGGGGGGGGVVLIFCQTIDNQGTISAAGGTKGMGNLGGGDGTNGNDGSVCIFEGV